MKRNSFRLLCCLLAAVFVLQLMPLTLASDLTTEPELPVSQSDEVTGEVAGIPETDIPEADALQTADPETDAPETDVPETDAPETDSSETDAPEIDVPEQPQDTQAPEAADALEASGELPSAAAVSIPSGWAHDALAFAVKNGILNGTGNGLEPEKYTTRAQMAVMLTRLIGAADTKGNLSVAGTYIYSYKDVYYGAWYAPYLSVAVRYGILTGTSSTTLSPDAFITREQAFTMIGRTLGMGRGKAADLARFSDGSKVSNYAVGYIADLVQAGYVNGDNKNQLRPKSPISRQELAQVLYNIFGKTGSIYQSGTLDGKGSVLYKSTGSQLNNAVINGNLVLSCSTSTLNLNNVTVKGNLVVFSRDYTKITLTGCSVTNIVILSQAYVQSTNPKTPVNYVVFCGATGAAFNGDANIVSVDRNATLNGNLGHVTVNSGNVTQSGGTITKLIIRPKAAKFHLNGTVEFAVTYEKHVFIDGSGTLNSVLVHGKGTIITCKCLKRQDDLNEILRGTQIVFTSQPPSASPTSPTATATVKFTGVNSGYGSTNGARIVTLKWYIDGVLKSTVNNFTIREGTTTTFSNSYSFYFGMKTTSLFKCEIYLEDEMISSTYTAKLNNYSDAYYANQTVRTSNGVIAPGDYTKQEKELFVNAKGYSSNTGWLVWVNLYHTKVNVFTGYKGNWKLVKTFNCAIGTNATPTPVGIYKIQTQEKYSRWDYGTWYVDTISRWHGGYAFHTRAKLKSNGKYFANDVNAMVSHGCIRMMTEDAAYIRDTVKLGSTVVTY